MAAITKSPPWETFYNEVVALFHGDSDIDVSREFGEGAKRINIRVNSDKKYYLLQKYLPTEKTFGAVKVSINIIPANATTEGSVADDMKVLFGDNKNVTTIATKSAAGDSVTYVAFKNGVVQFFDDNLADINLNKTMLMEDVARDVMKPIGGVFFCTNTPIVAKRATADDKKSAHTKSDFEKLMDLIL